MRNATHNRIRRPLILVGLAFFASAVSAGVNVSWREFNTGLNNLDVTALAIDRTGTRVYAGSYDGVFD
jgi:hypothetical protein